MITTRLHQQFADIFSSSPLVVRAPGRINLLGEHTDYNEGFVLPAAINFTAHVAIARRNDNRVVLYSAEFHETYETDLPSLHPVKNWPDYVTGVVAQLLKNDFRLSGFNLILTSNIPIGAGLSSSAAVECAVGYALNKLFDLKIETLQLARIAQRAEHEFAGTMCGIMDQFASLFGRKDHVVKLDCRSLEHQYLPFQFTGVEVVLLDTGVKHALASSEYNTRRQECAEGVSVIAKKYPQVSSLRDATAVMVDECIPTNSVIYNRCRYVVEENERLLAACDDLMNRDILAFGKKMFQTHSGLSNLYEVSCPELDFLVKHTKNMPGVLGARMMGGGFGGCTINLINSDQVQSVIDSASSAYRLETGKTLMTYRVSLADGASVTTR
ncbi:MAG: galactokinase [Flammeovirgaceae bacterium]|nr:MAG: galactokinase [Flammeovirgaceae bacterium]